MKSAEEFFKEILDAKLKPEKKDYGGNVLPAMKIYRSITDPKEYKSYQDALEMMLTSDDSEIRYFAINLCLGFYTFKDVE